MRQVPNITDAAIQVLSVIIADGGVVTLTLRLRPAIQGWTVDVAHTDLNVNNLMVVHSPNLLRQWRNVAPFGLACIADGADPSFAEDFASARCSLYILDSDEIENVETEIIAA